MRWWIAVASALLALLVVPAALAGGDDDRSGRDGKAYDKRHDDDGDRRGDWSRHDHDDDDDKNRDYGKDKGKDKGKDDRGSHQKPQDACPNVEGYQSAVPSMLVKDSSGSCVAPKITVAASSIASGPPVLAAALPSVVDVRPQAATPKVAKKAKKAKKVKKKAKKARAKKAKRKAKRAVRSRRAASFPRVLPFTR